MAAEALRVQDLTLGSMQEGVLLLDGRGVTAFGNQALTLHLGRRPEGVSQLYPPSVREMAEDVTANRRPQSIETEIGAPARWLRVTATPIGADGSVLLVIADVTETRRLDAIRQDFVANASHELKTPAASIQAGAETLRHAAHDDPEAIPRFAAQVERDAMRLSRIVADLLDLSRLESEQRAATNASHWTRWFEKRAHGSRTPRARPDSSSRSTRPTRRSMVGSSSDLSLLIRNLIDNAIRYTARRPGRGARGTEGGRVVLPVEDTGAGIPSRELPRVFERFYRVDRARSRETGGTGLGLAIVKHVAENHGGHVEVRSELGRGSIFEVRLPRRVCCRSVTTLFLIRHGLTAVTGKTLYGRTAVCRSTSVGVRRPRRSRIVSRAIRLTAVYSSPLDRCVETLAPLAVRQHLDIVTRERPDRDGRRHVDRSFARAGTPHTGVEAADPSPVAVPVPRRGVVRRRAGARAGPRSTRSRRDTRVVVWPSPRTATSSGCWSSHLSGAHLDLFQRTMSDPASVSVHLGRRRGPARPARQRHRQFGAVRAARRARERNLRG